MEPCLEQAVEPLTGVQRRRRAAIAACPQAECAAAPSASGPNHPRSNIAQTLSTDYGVEFSIDKQMPLAILRTLPRFALMPALFDPDLLRDIFGELPGGSLTVISDFNSHSRCWE